MPHLSSQRFFIKWALVARLQTTQAQGVRQHYTFSTMEMPLTCARASLSQAFSSPSLSGHPA